MAENNDIVKIEIIDEQLMKDCIFFIRGQYVMLDSDLAAIYGYSTKDFNRQVKNNFDKFDEEDFMFQLTKNEARMVLRCKISTTKADLKSQNATMIENRGGRRYSSKDGGNKVTTITLLTEATIYHPLFDQALQNKPLILN